MRAAIYARISEDRDETRLGVERQLEDCEKLAQARGWGVVDRYVDNDVSAWKAGGIRPEWLRMLNDIADHQVEAVVTYHQDRLVRQPRDLELLFDVCEAAGMTNLASVSGDINLADDRDRMTARILGAVAANESDAKSRRIRRKHQELARNGKISGGGTRPFGFESDRVTIREDEAKVIRELADRVLAGASVRSLCGELAERGVSGPTGRPWVPQTLKRMLRSGRVSGQREHHGEIVATAEWPAIIRPEQTAQLRAILDDPSRRHTRAARRYVLKGLLRCERCGTSLVSRPREDGQRRYVCARGPGFAGCGKTFVLAEPLEEFVTEAVLIALDSPELAQAVRGAHDDTASEWQQKLDAVETQLEELAATYGEGDLPHRQWLAARQPLERRLEEARRHLSRAANTGAASRHLGAGKLLRERWGEMDVEQRHAVISAVLAHVEVGPGRRGLNRFDPDRFGLVWRY